MDRATFRRQIEYALAGVRDVVRLRPMDLCDVLVPEAPPSERGWELSRFLLEAIDLMRPGGEEPPESWPRRRYSLLSLRYVNGMSVDQAAERLCLSRRHFYRLLRRALDDLADMLWARVSDDASSINPATSRVPDSGLLLLEREVATTVARADGAYVDEVLATVIEILEPLRRRSDVNIHYQAPTPLPAVPVSAEVFRQILLGLLGDLIKQGYGRDVHLAAEHQGDWVEVSLIAYLPPGVCSQRLKHAVSPVYEEMARLQGVALNAAVDEDEGAICYRLRIPATRGKAVLVVEDNVEVSQLFQLYLASAGYEPVIATSGRQAVTLAQRRPLFAITLDLMMAEEDGWDVLQQIRHHPETENIPVIVCSVLDQEELALMLGADGFLGKPVTRDALLNALADLSRVSSPRHRAP